MIITQGAIFTPSTYFALYEQKNQRGKAENDTFKTENWTLFYGGNGIGMSTIVKTFWKVKDEIYLSNKQNSNTDLDDKYVTTISEDENNYIYALDEKYADNKTNQKNYISIPSQSADLRKKIENVVSEGNQTKTTICIIELESNVYLEPNKQKCPTSRLWISVKVFEGKDKWFLDGHEFTEAFVTTYVIRVIYDIHEMFEEIVSSYKKRGDSLLPKYDRCRIKDFNNTQIFSNRQEHEPFLLVYGSYNLGQRSRSISLNNIHFNLRELLKVSASLGASVVIPQSAWGYIVLGLNFYVFASGMIDCFTKDIPENEAYIVAFLHIHNMYDHGLLEDEFELAFNKWYQEKIGEKNDTTENAKGIEQSLRKEVGGYRRGRDSTKGKSMEK